MEAVEGKPIREALKQLYKTCIQDAEKPNEHIGETLLARIVYLVTHDFDSAAKAAPVKRKEDAPASGSSPKKRSKAKVA